MLRKDTLNNVERDKGKKITKRHMAGRISMLNISRWIPKEEKKNGAEAIWRDNEYDLYKSDKRHKTDFQKDDEQQAR